VAFALTIVQSFAVSSAFTLTDVGPLVVAVPSWGAGWQSVRVEFSTISGGPVFGPFLTPQPAVLPLAVWSGAGPGYGVLLTPPTPYGRLAITGSMAATGSFTVLPLRT